MKSCMDAIALCLASCAAMTQTTPSLELRVTAGGEFSPLEWRVIASSGNQDLVVVGPPNLSVQVWVDGEFLGYGDLPKDDQRRHYAGREALAARSGAVSRASPCEQIVWQGQFTDWQCCGIPGRYRLRAQASTARGWPGRGRDFTPGHFPVQPLDSEWVEVLVAAPSRGARVLQLARESDGAEWRSYQAFMESDFNLGALGASPGADELFRAHELIQARGRQPDHIERLRGVPDLPPLLVARLDLAQSLCELVLGRAANSAGERDMKLSSAAGYATSARAQGSAFCDTISSLVQLSVAEARGLSATAANLRASCRSQSGTAEVLRACPQVSDWLEGRRLGADVRMPTRGR